MDLTIGERLIVLEHQMTHLETDAHKRELKQDEILKKLDDIVSDNKNLKNFMGGALWVASAMAVALYHVIPWLISFFRAKAGNG